MRFLLLKPEGAAAKAGYFVRKADDQALAEVHHAKTLWMSIRCKMPAKSNRPRNDHSQTCCVCRHNRDHEMTGY